MFKTIDKDKKSISFFSGSFFIIIALDYLASTFKALGMGKNFYFILNFALFFLVVFAFVFLRKGLDAELDTTKNKLLSSTKYQYKTLGAVLLSVATSISAYYGSYSFISAIILGLCVFFGWYLYYGFDVKLDNHKVTKSSKRIENLLIVASKDIEDIKSYAEGLESSDASLLMYKMANAFEDIVEHILNEPEDYDMARKYLVSYLSELKSISKIFVKLDKNERTQSVEDEFVEILKNSIDKLKQEYKKLLDDDILELDIKLSVMKKRLKYEE